MTGTGVAVGVGVADNGKHDIVDGVLVEERFVATNVERVRQSVEVHVPVGEVLCKSNVDVWKQGGSSGHVKAVDEGVAVIAGIFDLRLDVLYDLRSASFDDVIQFRERARTTAVAKVDDFAVVFVAGRLGIAVCAFELFGFALLAVENTRDVARDVQTAEGKNGEMTKQFTAVDSHGGGFAPHVHEDATCAALLFTGHHTGQTIGCHRVAHNR